jgi:hypothetical protein
MSAFGKACVITEYIFWIVVSWFLSHAATFQTYVWLTFHALKNCVSFSKSFFFLECFVKLQFVSSCEATFCPLSAVSIFMWFWLNNDYFLTQHYVTGLRNGHFIHCDLGALTIVLLRAKKDASCIHRLPKRMCLSSKLCMWTEWLIEWHDTATSHSEII